MEIDSSSGTIRSASYNTSMVGFYAALLTVFLTLVTFGIAILTPPISGSGCRASCIDYPFLEIESRFPRDYYWMYPAILLTAVYVMLMVCIHQYAPIEKKIFSMIGLSFALMAGAVLIVDYFVQISVIQPSILNDETDGIALLTQYNPHGLFIALEEIGYVMMSVAFIFMAPVFSGTNRSEQVIRWSFRLSLLLIVAAFVLFSLSYGIDRGYRFEITAISIDWLVLVLAGIPLSIVFRRTMHMSA